MGGWAGAVGGGAQPRRIRRPPRSRFRARPHPPPAPAEPFPMLNLREYRHRADRLADHLPWAALVADGVIFNKDGSFQRTLAFRGPELESEHEAELVSACAPANNAPKRFGTGGALVLEADRPAALGYPANVFP